MDHNHCDKIYMLSSWCSGSPRTMTLDAGFDIKLEEVDGAGLPKNRSIWCYDVTVAGRTRKICLDFKGRLSITNPANFDAKKPSDNDLWEWGSVKYLGLKTKKPKTVICWNAKKDADAVKKDGKIRLCFVGPAEGSGGDVSLRTETHGKIKNSNRTAWQDMSRGSKSGMETPIAMVLPDDVSEHEGGSDAQDLVATIGVDDVIGLDDMQNPFETEILSNVIDLAEVFSVDTEDLAVEALERLSLKSLSDIDEAVVSRVGETLGVETVGELATHDVMAKLRLAIRSTGF